MRTLTFQSGQVIVAAGCAGANNPRLAESLDWHLPVQETVVLPLGAPVARFKWQINGRGRVSAESISLCALSVSSDQLNREQTRDD